MLTGSGYIRVDVFRVAGTFRPKSIRSRPFTSTSSTGERRTRNALDGDTLLMTLIFLLRGAFVQDRRSPSSVGSRCLVRHGPRTHATIAFLPPVCTNQPSGRHARPFSFTLAISVSLLIPVKLIYAIGGPIDRNTRSVHFYFEIYLCNQAVV